MTPESECYECSERIVATTMERLIEAEKEHHNASLGMGEVDGALQLQTHGCGTFEVYDEGGVKKVGEHHFAHGKLRHTNQILVSMPRLRE